MTLIQLPDELRSDVGEVQCLGTGGIATYRMSEFLIGDCPSGRRYFGMVASPQRNLNRTGLSATQETTLTGLEALLEGTYTRESVVEEAFIHAVMLLCDISGGEPEVVTLRSQTSTTWRRATEEEVVRYMSLPEPLDPTRIGSINGTDAGIYIDRKRLVYHTLLAGATGSGKSNCGANIIKAGLSLGFATVVYDHKPDYQDMGKPNGDLPSEQQMTIDARHWKLDTSSAGGQQIYVPASAFTPAALAATLMPFPNENQMREDLESSLEIYADMQECEKPGQAWRLCDWYDWLCGHGGNPPEADAAEPYFGYKPHKQTYKGMLRRVLRDNRKPSWVDGRSVSPAKRERDESSFMRGRSSSPSIRWFDPVGQLEPGKVLCIKVNGSESGRDYGLFLDFMLRAIYNARVEGQCPPVHHFIDEAQDIFNAEKSFKAAAEQTLSAQIRKGRSKSIAYTIAVQSAAAIPTDILNNLNSKVIMRHNDASEVKTAIGKATEGQRQQVQHFGPGQALVDMFGSTAVVQGKMLRSPFQLTIDMPEEDD